LLTSPFPLNAKITQASFKKYSKKTWYCFLNPGP